MQNDKCRRMYTRDTRAYIGKRSSRMFYKKLCLETFQKLLREALVSWEIASRWGLTDTRIVLVERRVAIDEDSIRKDGKDEHSSFEAKKWPEMSLALCVVHLQIASSHCRLWPKGLLSRRLVLIQLNEHWIETKVP